MQNDVFANIAAGGIGGKKDLLYIPSPVSKNGKKVCLRAGGTPKSVLPKMSTKEELQEALGKERDKMKPFLLNLSPTLPKMEEREELKNFDYRLQTGEKEPFSDVLSGAGEWEQVTIPHYGAPVGKACAYYRTTFFGKREEGKRKILSFGGVDYLGTVYVNGWCAGTHEGFFSPFTLDITEFVRDGENTLVIEVDNDFIYMGNKTPDGEVFFGDKLYAATGIGYDDPALGWHHCPPGMGIYNKMYLRTLPNLYLSDLFVRPLPGEGQAELWIETDSSLYTPTPVEFEIKIFGKNFEEHGLSLTFSPTSVRTVGLGDSLTEASAKNKGELGKDIPLFAKKGKNVFKLRVDMGDFRLWTPDTPWLYEAQVILKTPGGSHSIARTFGMRSFTQDLESEPKGMFYLNDNPIRLRGANTMGFEQLSVMREDYDRLIDDILLAKICRMNFLRLTQRPVQEEVYDYCDRLGLLTQTDLPLFGCMRRNKFAEGIRQAEEMERLVRSHPSNILVTYINEPFPNASNEPHRNMERDELEAFFEACDRIVHQSNPDRVIKHVDGDYDPPSTDMPDNHCYPMWYNGHGIDIGRLYKGYWMHVKPSWYYGCGEFGVEGLDFPEVMWEEYPKEWMACEREEDWNPSQIVNAQTGAFYYMFYDRQKSVEAWTGASQKHQAFGVRLMTEAFRRNKNMNSFAVHLFIDAWPSGWMKTIMDVRRNPKKAYFAYRDALEDVLVSLRADKWSYFSGEKMKVECFIANDTNEALSGEIFYELYEGDSLIATGKSMGEVNPCDAAYIEEVEYSLPKVAQKKEFTLRAHFGEHYGDFSFAVFPFEELEEGDVYIGKDIKAAEEAALNGKTAILDRLPIGEHTVGGRKVKVSSAGMLPLHFVSRASGNPLVDGFDEKDFSYWYEEKEDMITPILHTTFVGEGVTPILLSGNMNERGEWGEALAMGEIPFGKGKIYICQAELFSRLENPAARKLYHRMLKG